MAGYDLSTDTLLSFYGSWLHRIEAQFTSLLRPSTAPTTTVPPSRPA